MLIAKSSDWSFRAKRSVFEEWSEGDQRHGRLCREGSGKGVGRRTSSISYCYAHLAFNFDRCLDSARHDKSGIARGRKFHPSFPIASVGQASMARSAAAV